MKTDLEAGRSSLALYLTRPALLVGLVFTLGGCQVVPTIVKAGVSVGILRVLGLLIVGGSIAALAGRDGA